VTGVRPSHRCPIRRGVSRTKLHQLVGTRLPCHLGRRLDPLHRDQTLALFLRGAVGHVGLDQSRHNEVRPDLPFGDPEPQTLPVPTIPARLLSSILARFHWLRSRPSRSIFQESRKAASHQPADADARPRFRHQKTGTGTGTRVEKKGENTGCDRRWDAAWLRGLSILFAGVILTTLCESMNIIQKRRDRNEEFL
jgi:hypothetical protein